MTGLVVKKQADKFTVDSGKSNTICTARGLLKDDGIFVGDKVDFNTETMQIEKVFERKNKLIRPPLSNLDNLFILMADKPLADYFLLDKMLLFCGVYGIKPIICISKIDLSKKQVEYIEKVYGKYYKIFKISSLTGEGVEEVKKALKGKISAFAGQSGVGKSALINAIFGENTAVVGLLSDRIERGKNTTRHTQLYKLGANTYVADTAGFSSLDEKLLPLSASELPYYYPEFIGLLAKCKFKSCMHINEPDCAVKQAVAVGKIDQARYERYLSIFNTLK